MSESSTTDVPSTKTVPSTPPRTPTRYAKRLEDYARESVELGDSPRHSKESQRSLLRGHERQTSLSSIDGTPKRANGAILGKIDEEGGRRSRRKSHSRSDSTLPDGYEDDDEFPSIRRRDDYAKEDSESAESLLGRTGSAEGKSSTILGKVTKAKTFIHDNRGLLMIALAQGAFACMNVLVKLMTANAEIAMPIWELILTRMSITWIFCYITLRVKKVPDPLLGPRKVRGWLALRGIVGFFGLFGSYTSLQYLSLSDATVLGFLAPTVTGVLASIFLREPYTWREATAGLVSLGGTILVAQPAFLFGSFSHDEDGVAPEERLMAVGIALLGVLGASAAYVTIRNIGNRAHALHGVQYFCMGCTIVGLAMPILVPSQKVVLPHKPIFWAYLAAIGVFGFTAQYLLGKALQVERVGRAMLGNYTQLPWALFLQYLIFQETMDFLSCIGAAIIMGSTIWVVMSKQKEAKPTVLEAGDLETGNRMSVEQERATVKLEANLLPNAPVITVPPKQAMAGPSNDQSHSNNTSLWFEGGENTVLPK